MRRAWLGIWLWGLLPLTGVTQTTALAPATRPALDSAACLARARARIEVLCSDSLAGRGYALQGHRKAAGWIAEELSAVGLSPQTDRFTFALNRVTGARLQVGGETLTYGRDFLVSGPSGPLVGTYPVIDLGHGLPSQWQRLRPRVPGSLVVLRPGLPQGHGLPDSLARLYGAEITQLSLALQLGGVGVIWLRPKLTAGFATEAYPLAVLEVQDSIWRPATPEVELALATGVDEITSQNVWALVPGAVSPDTVVVLTAHYDHLGRVEGATFRGASDNASGVAFLLALADSLVRHPPRYSTLLLATGAEEVGLVGSQSFVERLEGRSLRRDGPYVLGVLNFDLMGNGEAGLVAVAGQTYPRLYTAFEAALRQRAPTLRLRARENRPNSDHWPFTQVGIPALFLYTEGGPPNYHDIYDTPDQLGLPVFYPVLASVVGFLHRPGLAQIFLSP
ncbi:MAG: M28 family peptidase [Bacteroidia bacterium]|nr:M28 family peptidase [Bacteroidia bacterium]